MTCLSREKKVSSACGDGRERTAPHDRATWRRRGGWSTCLRSCSCTSSAARQDWNAATHSPVRRSCHAAACTTWQRARVPAAAPRECMSDAKTVHSCTWTHSERAAVVARKRKRVRKRSAPPTSSLSAAALSMSSGDGSVPCARPQARACSDAMQLPF